MYFTPKCITHRDSTLLTRDKSIPSEEQPFVQAFHHPPPRGARHSLGEVVEVQWIPVKYKRNVTCICRELERDIENVPEDRLYSARIVMRPTSSGSDSGTIPTSFETASILNYPWHL